MKARDILEEAYDKIWDNMPNNRRAIVVGEALNAGEHGHLNVVVLKIADVKWGDIPEVIATRLKTWIASEEITL